MEIQLVYKSISLLHSKEKQNKTKQSWSLCGFLGLSDTVTIRSLQNTWDEIRKSERKKKMWKVVFLYNIPQKIVWVIKELPDPGPVSTSEISFRPSPAA